MLNILEGNDHFNERTKKHNCGRYRKDIVKDDEFIAAHEDDEAQIQSMNSLEKDVKKYKYNNE